MEMERRRFKRANIESVLRYQIKGTQNFSNTVLKDYSEGGIGFLSNEFFPHTQKLILEFALPGSLAQVKTVGEVVWIKFRPYSESFLVGAKFVEPLLKA